MINSEMADEINYLLKSLGYHSDLQGNGVWAEGVYDDIICIADRSGDRVNVNYSLLLAYLQKAPNVIHFDKRAYTPVSDLWDWCFENPYDANLCYHRQ